MAKQTGYTPGPWHIGVKQAGINIYDAHGWQVADASPLGDDSNGECKANGRLIAAAPELVEALRELAAECETCDGFDPNLEGPEHDALKSARAILARIRGEE
jgi:hypothetical protein